ncbi:hypothetical protein BDZ85DRAFT_291947 [Elsinoe ampelina]|uniref:Tyrosine--tRNA ligase n=1 Tax=Elsinoe ampelina TaxID=302913 RepID=A0A6A6FZP9_9PEZI|nr:hypothetical protein BDZ85DRAFT_291947 [Elsinoe ampelina]
MRVARLRLKSPSYVLRSQRRSWASLPRGSAPSQEATLEGQSDDVLGILEQRGLIKDVAGDRGVLRGLLQQNEIAAYSGIDPTASSLHLGHLLPLNILFWLHNHGHRAVSLLGDATVRIGDPTDRLQARKELGTDQRTDNISNMKRQLDQLWANMNAMTTERAPPMAPSVARHTIDSNNRWLSKLSITDYLATVGQCGKMGAMLSRETVKNRLEKGESMSLAEFNYPMIQAYDWWYMFRESGVQVQIGGSDQYGNIVAGMDLIDYMARRHATPAVKDRKPFGITTPLLTSSAGDKFGKSAGNAVWLDSNLTKPFDLYGYLLRTADDDVERFLNLLTLVPNDSIKEIMVEHSLDPSRRKGQHLLALEICRLAYGKDWAARTAAEHAKSRKLTLQDLVQDDAGKRLYLPRTLFEVCSISHILLYAGIVDSASKANILRRSGGLYRAVQNPSDTQELTFEALPTDKASKLSGKDLLLDGRFAVIRSGKWKMSTIEVVDDADFEGRGFRVKGLDDWRGKVESLHAPDK